MDKKNAKGAIEFEPPKYLASLIAAINDGAKAAQGGALGFLLVGIYLLASAFSSSDEDLLLGKTVIISQIGASLPVSFSFAIAPLVFVFLHVYTLLRYDMLAANVRQFLRELRDSVPLEPDRERLRQLLANVEFVAALTTSRGSTLYSRFWASLFFGIVALFPVAVLLLVQINALRYQSDMIVWVQRAWLALDLAVLMWFFARDPFYEGETKDVPVWRRAVRGGLLFGVPALVLLLNFAWLSPVSPKTDLALVRYEHRKEHSGPSFADLVRQPLDMLACRGLNWGCRYLRVDHRTLVDHVWDTKGLAGLRAPRTKLARAPVWIDGVVLRYRFLRFALLDASRLYAADFTSADLRGASLVESDLSGATLFRAKMAGTNLRDAQLEGADLSYADLESADLSYAHLEGADLYFANLEGADLSNAFLRGANLSSANLQGTNLLGAQLEGADLSLAHMEGADLSNAHLEGADLSYAHLEGADLSNAMLRGANLRKAKLWRVHSRTDQTDLTLGDVRDADHMALDDEERRMLRESQDAVPSGVFKLNVERRLERVLAADEPLAVFDFVASRERPVLVSAPPEPALAKHPDWLITEPTAAYTEALTSYLASELASTDPFIAAGIANDISRDLAMRSEWAGVLARDVPIACRLLSETTSRRVRLEQSLFDELSRKLKNAQPDCTAAARP